MNAKITALALATLAGSVLAQNSIVNNLPGTFVDISTNAGFVSLNNGANADDANYAFTSTVTNSMFAATTVRACTNGFIQFGGTSGAASFTNATIAVPGTNSPVLAATTQALFPFWDDLYVRGTTGASLGYLEASAASLGLNPALGNVLIVQWTGVEHFSSTPSGATFQVQIYQNPQNNIAAQMLYSDTIFDNPIYDSGITATAGFASGTTGGPASLNNVLYSFNQAVLTDGLVLSLMLPVASYPPTGIGASTGAGGGNLLFTVTVSPGGNPASSNITVTGDLSSLGGSSSVAFLDNGLGGDVAAGDGVYSHTASYGTAIDGDAISVPFTVADSQARSSNGTITGTIDAAGQTLATANVPAGSGSLDSISGFFSPNDVDMYRINICDFANFSATTVGGTTVDTQLFLFDTAGLGVTFNDDSTGLQSTITSQFVTGNGDYYLAVSRYDIDPVDAGGQALWIDTPFAVERAPDGPGAGNALDRWDGANAATAAYTISLTGACYVSTGPACGPADIGSTGGTPGADGRLDNNDFIVFIDRFFNNAASADIGTTGGAPGSDGQWNNNDFIVFIDQFFSGPASCR